jgi:hypothetical protein
MITVAYDTQLGANATVQNALVGGPIAIAPNHGLLHLYGREEATAAGKLRLDLMIGTEMVMQNRPMTRNDALSPNKLEDHLGSFPVVKGTALIATIREVNGVAMDLNIIFEFEAKALQELIAIAGG